MQTRSKKAKATTTCPANLFSTLPDELISKIAAHVITGDLTYKSWEAEFKYLGADAERLAERRATIASRIYTEFSHWPHWLLTLLIAEEFKRITMLENRRVATMHRINNDVHMAFNVAFDAKERDIPFLTSSCAPMGVGCSVFDGLKTKVLLTIDEFDGLKTKVPRWASGSVSSWVKAANLAELD